MLAVALHLQQICDDIDKVHRGKKRIRNTVALVTAHLDVEFESANAGQIEPPSIEEHSFEQTISGRNGRRIAGTHLTVDLKQGIDRLGDRVLPKRCRDDLADNVAFREEDRELGDAALNDLLELVGRDLGIRFDDDLARFGVDDVLKCEHAFEIGRHHADLVLLEMTQVGKARFRDLLAGADDIFLLVLDVLIGTHPDKIRLAGFLDLEIDLTLLDQNGVGRVEELQDARVAVLSVLYDLFENVVRDRLHIDLRIEPQAESTQEHGRDDLSLTETGVQNPLLVVFELDPRTAVRDDLRQEFIAVALEENAGRAMQLRNDNAFGSVDDEGAVIGHQRDLAKENVLFLDVAHGRNARIRILVIDRQADLHLKRYAV